MLYLYYTTQIKQFRNLRNKCIRLAIKNANYQLKIIINKKFILKFDSFCHLKNIKYMNVNVSQLSIILSCF